MRVLYIDLDCVRADHLGVNGYSRNTSPNIDAIAREGITFTQCHCANSPCVPSRASLFSGRFGINNGVVAHHGVGEVFRGLSSGHWRDPEKPMLSEHLWHSGMKTTSFSSFADRHNAWWFANGWQELNTHTRKKGQETADEVNAAFLPYIKQNCEQDDWFIHLHYWDCHSHYRVPEEWVGRFHDEEGPAWPDAETIAAHQEFYGPRTARDLYTGYEFWMGDGMHAPVSYMPDAVRGEPFDGWAFQVWDHGIYTFTRSVRTEEYLLLTVLHPGLYPYDEPYYLYDLRTDLHQCVDIAGERPEVVGDLLRMLHDWRDEQLRKGCAPDPLEAMVREGPFTYYAPEHMAARLAAAGRTSAAESLKRRLRRFHGGKYDGAFAQGIA